MNYSKEQNDIIKNNVMDYLIKSIANIVCDYAERIIISGVLTNTFYFENDKIDHVIVNNDKIYTTYHERFFQPDNIWKTVVHVYSNAEEITFLNKFDLIVSDYVYSKAINSVIISKFYKEIYVTINEYIYVFTSSDGTFLRKFIVFDDDDEYSGQKTQNGMSGQIVLTDNDKSLVIMNNYSKYVKIYNTRTGNCIKKYNFRQSFLDDAFHKSIYPKCHFCNPLSLAVSENHNYISIVTGNYNESYGYIDIYDTNSGKLVQHLKMSNDYIYTIYVHDDILYMSDNRYITTINLMNNRKLSVFGQQEHKTFKICGINNDTMYVSSSEVVHGKFMMVLCTYK